MKFTKSSYEKAKNGLKLKYEKELPTIIAKIKKQKYSATAMWLKDYSRELKKYSPERWYLLEQLSKLSYFYENNKKLSTNSEDFLPIDEAIFDEWNKSEFADTFLKELNQGRSIKDSSEVTLYHFDQHVAVLADRVTLNTNHSNEWYRPQSSLGEIQKKNIVAKLLDSTLVIDHHPFKLMTNSLTEMKLFSGRIDNALKIIRTFSPSSWERFVAFTNVIIPLKEEKLVSYSHQELPGYSIINLYHRDFVDLIDDLLHENGHHHMNYYLNQKKLIDEPLEAVYYSPWRRTLRPLRGIYHAYFTFFWAFKVFADFSIQKSLSNEWYKFSDEEKAKIYWRAVEEFYMLSYSFEDLKWAKEKGLIKSVGWKLIESQQTELLKFSTQVNEWEKKIGLYKKELNQLKLTLKNSRKLYVLDSI